MDIVSYKKMIVIKYSTMEYNLFEFTCMDLENSFQPLYWWLLMKLLLLFIRKASLISFRDDPVRPALTRISINTEALYKLMVLLLVLI